MSDETNEQVNAPAEGEVQINDEAQAEQAKGDQGEEQKDAPKPEEGDDEQEGDQDRPKRLSGAQRLKRRNEFLLNEIAQRDRELEELRRQASPKAGEEQEPKEADFNGDWQAYERARNAHEIRKVLREERQRELEAQRSTAQVNAIRELRLAHAEREDEARETITDYDKVVHAAKDIRISPEVVREILASEKSALLTYYLSKNPEKALALNAMSGRELAREIGRLEGSVRMPAAKKQTNTPPPLSKVAGGAAQSFDPKAASMDDYIAKRQSGWDG